MTRLLARLLSKLFNPLKVVPWALKSAGDGAFGPGVQKIYWVLAKRKGYIVAGATAIGAFLVELQHTAPSDCAAISCSVIYQYLNEWGPVILGALVVSAVDDGVRADPPKPKEN